MILKIETEINGNFRIENNFEVKYNPYNICIKYNDKEQKYFISIAKKMYNYSSLLPKLEQVGQEKTIKFPNENFLENEIELLQHIESFGAIDKEVYDINWGNVSIEWIPESEQEKKEISIKKYSRSFSFQKEKGLLSQEWLFNTIIHKRRLEHLTLPFSFFRNGLKHYKEFQYQESFLNFYLMLEGVFGNGKFKNDKIKSEFKKSPMLIQSIEKLLGDLKNSQLKHYEWFKEMSEKYNKEPSIESVIHIIVEQRGNLSHFSNKNNDRNKNPYKDKDFDSLAFITLMICKYVSNDLRLEPFR
jgi:hypothetical protein